MKRITRHRGFSLLELLVAASVTLVLAGMMLALTRATTELWQRTQAEAVIVGQARLVFDSLERDLHAAVFRPDGTTIWLSVDVIDRPVDLPNHGWRIETRMKPTGASSERLAAASLEEARFGLSGAWLRFVTIPAEAAGGLPCAASYQLIRRPVSGSVTAATNPAEVRYTLFRSAVSAEVTWQTGYDVLSVGYASASPNPSVARSAPTLMNPPMSDALASGVVDFGVWLYVRESDGELRRIFPMDNADRSHAARSDAAAADADRFPAVIDVMMRVLTDEGARLIGAMEQGGMGLVRPAEFATDDDWWWVVVEAHSRVFVRRIEIGGSG